MNVGWVNRIGWAGRAAVWLCGCCVIAALGENESCAQDPLRVMSYNVWTGGINGSGLPLSATVGVIQAAQADIIGIQEVGGSAAAIANSLGFHYHGFNNDLAIVSRYPITEVLSQGVKLRLSPSLEAYVFDAHLDYDPYQPYDIRDRKLTTEAQVIAAARSTHGGEIDSVLNGMTFALALGAPVFLVGDFNEPSHLDWTKEAASAGMHFGMNVDWPTSRSVTDAGLVDAFRELRPDEVADPGFTWTPGYPAPNVDADEVHDRIDFVYYSGANVTPTIVQTLGYDAADGSTDIAIQPYPSDHRAVVVKFDMPACFAAGDLNGDCSLGIADWMQFRSGQHIDMTGFTRGEAFAAGDLTGDLLNNHADFALFKTYFESANGVGSFAAMLSAVPEPASAVFLNGLVIAVIGVRRRRSR